jgi:hypothetical protein
MTFRDRVACLSPGRLFSSLLADLREEILRAPIHDRGESHPIYPLESSARILPRCSNDLRYLPLVLGVSVAIPIRRSGDRRGVTKKFRIKSRSVCRERPENPVPTLWSGMESYLKLLTRTKITLWG